MKVSKIILILFFFCNSIIETFAQQGKYLFSTFAGGNSDGYLNGNGKESKYNAPEGIAVDKYGNVYTTEYKNATIRKITKDGKVTTLAGKDTLLGIDDGNGANARFNRPHGLTVDDQLNVYVVECKSNTIRKIDSLGNVKTIAGIAGKKGANNGLANVSTFNFPEDIAINSKGILFVADTYNYVVRQISVDGIVTTYAGKAGVAGSADGNVSNARFNMPIGIAIDGADNIYIVDADYDNDSHGNCTVRKISIDGKVTTIAGLAGKKGKNDGYKSKARFNRPVGIAVSKNGEVYIADTEADTIRKIDKLGNVTTIGGKYLEESKSDGLGSNARFNDPQAIDIDSNGTLYIADTFNHRIVKGELIKK